MLSPHKNGASFGVRLAPSSRQNTLLKFERVADTVMLKASVTAVPEKGKANNALMKLLAQKLRLPKSAIRLIAGETSRLKTILVEGDSDEIIAYLNNQFRELGLTEPESAGETR